MTYKSVLEVIMGKLESLCCTALLQFVISCDTSTASTLKYKQVLYPVPENIISSSFQQLVVFLLFLINNVGDLFDILFRTLCYC